jgi:hypothetical protein
MAGEDATITEADVRAAQTVLDVLDDAGILARTAELGPATTAYLKARGALAGFAADCRWAGYLEGQQDGRRQAARIVRTALEDEGL